VKRYLAMNRYIGGTIVQPTVRRTSSFIILLSECMGEREKKPEGNGVVF
jgi:hypothetical protein